MIPIILQTYNRVSYTMQVISAIQNHLLYPYYLIVIDNASTDGTVEYLQFLKKQNIIQELILNSSNLGISEPKNQGLDIVKKLENIKYVCITDNDIVVPFIRPACVLTKIVEMMDLHPEVGMCGIDLDRANAPANQEWWWRLRQHPSTNPTFAEISIGFWFSVIRYEHIKDFRFNSSSLYGRADESCRNFLGLEKKSKIGLLKGVYDPVKKETISKVGTHLGWTEDLQSRPDYVNFKKAERYKAEKEWQEKNRKW